VGLDVAADTGQPRDDLPVALAPVGLERLQGHPGLALEERDDLDHVRVATLRS